MDAIVFRGTPHAPVPKHQRQQHPLTTRRLHNIYTLYIGIYYTVLYRIIPFGTYEVGLSTVGRLRMDDIRRILIYYYIVFPAPNDLIAVSLCKYYTCKSKFRHDRQPHYIYSCIINCMAVGQPSSPPTIHGETEVKIRVARVNNIGVFF